MRLAYSLLAIASVSGQQLLSAELGPAGRAGIRLKTTLAGQSLILNDVFLNGDGPFRMLVDTGNSTSIIRAPVARRLNLQPTYSVEMATVTQIRRVPATVLEKVRVGAVTDRFV